MSFKSEGKPGSLLSLKSPKATLQNTPHWQQAPTPEQSWSGRADIVEIKRLFDIMKQKPSEILRRLISSDGFRIYFWPIIAVWLFMTVLMFLFLPLEPDSSREALFVCIGNLTCLTFIWFLVFRYRQVKGKSVGKRTLVLLLVLSMAFLFYLAVFLFSRILLLVR